MKYHVGTSNITGAIYAGKATKKGNWLEWKEKDEVTDEVINAVMAHMLMRVEAGDDSFAYMNKTRDGKYLRLMLEVADQKPEWLDEQAEEV